MTDAKIKGIFLGAGILCVAGFLLFLGGTMKPLSSDAGRPSVPKLEDLGVVLSETPAGVVAPQVSKEPAKKNSADRRGSSGNSRLEPPPAVKEELKKDGSIVY